MKNCFIKILVLLSVLGSLPAVASGEVVLNVRDYGAVGDGVAMDTLALQETIDACAEKGGGTVWVPAGDYQIGSIKLKSHVTLSLDYGATLLGSQDIADYVNDMGKKREGSGHCLIYAVDATDIRIEGLGEIDGRGTPEAFPRKQGSPRPHLLNIINCERVTLSGVTYRRPASWGLHFVDSKDIHIDGVTVRFRNNGYNNDGLDLDGCENVLIENCDIDAGDDGICLKSSKNPCRNFVIRNCKVASNTAPLKLGTSSRGGFIDIKVTNCYFYDSPMGAIKLQLVDGGRLENVDISRIVMEDVGNPIFIRLGNRGRSYENFKGQKYNADVEPEGVPVGTLRNVRIRDVNAVVTVETRENAYRATHMKKDLMKRSDEEWEKMAKTKSGPIMISGIPGHLVEDVLLENIRISFPGGGTEEDAAQVVPEDIARYPEQFFFGVLPAWGAYVRHAKDVTFRNVALELREPDARERIVLEDVVGFTEE
ncbi:glycoside hydrolase family 28 protein [Pelagicoccus sp. SDUM812005]|uniref:glycoside hydrolase family 28 protein n=1 Tax=Pelagicoccus sp. SDUM812005 TaxID=3041257 RepID=UPI00280C6FA0|nr:glycoside hydrolase family 28 protein [Pelagicoccus sp. SDUM812005]MDQ8183291.1 glycoside hydrolase family 28 protein [Pelagicoccus sp. SDUM812005]